MHAAKRVAGTICGGVAAMLLSSCGGGGYGGGGMGSTMPSIMFSSPAMGASVNLGQAVKVAWTTTYASSCTASTSASGGAFSGTQPTSGQMTVAPTATGSVTYTLTCTGLGGTTMSQGATIMVNPSLLAQLTSSAAVSIGSTLDPTEHGGNPYGLAIAPATSGLMTKGDLIVCNFNDGATNTQGLGTTIVGLHPVNGATPYRIAQSATLEGCNALAVLADDSIAATAFSAGQVPLVSAAGALATPFASDTFTSPWGVAYVAASGGAAAALYVTNLDGSIDRITLNADAQASFEQIVTGFCASGVPGAVFAPAGLTYDAAIDTLYVVDTSSNSVVALANVSAIGAGGLVVDGQCNSVGAPPTPAPTFSGTAAASARVIAHGGPFIAPISAALLADGNLIVGNGDINIGAGQMPNLAIEVSPVLPGGFVGAPVQLDTSGTPGALFGIAAIVDGTGNQVLFYNDDNTNTVLMLKTVTPPAMGGGGY